MQYEVKRRPGNNSPGPVKGFPSKQKAQQQSGNFGRPAVSRTTGSAPVQRQVTAYQKAGSRPVAKPQSTTAFVNRPSLSNMGTMKRGSVSQPVQSGFKPANLGRSISRYPAGSAVKSTIQNSRFVPDPVMSRSNSRPWRNQPASGNQFRTQVMGSANSLTSYQQPYIFEPVPDIPPKMPTGTGGGSIPNPDKIPVDIPDKQPCSCGQTGIGCTVLDKFATGSKDLTEEHWKQLETLADTIIKKQMQFVTITGHTDAVGTDEKNQVLGIKRANEVAKELKNTIHRQEPWAETNVFFKTKTRGEEEPASAINNEANRRVVVCLQQVP